MLSSSSSTSNSRKTPVKEKTTFYSTLKIGAISSSETSVVYYQTAQRYTLEFGILQGNRFGNSKSTTHWEYFIITCHNLYLDWSLVIQINKRSLGNYNHAIVINILPPLWAVTHKFYLHKFIIHGTFCIIICGFIFIMSVRYRKRGRNRKHMQEFDRETSG
jgi:hypothetical protein